MLQKDSVWMESLTIAVTLLVCALVWLTSIIFYY